jgi:hypothetical protein
MVVVDDSPRSQADAKIALGRARDADPGHAYEYQIRYDGGRWMIVREEQ